jgi:hypothetical protein
MKTRRGFRARTALASVLALAMAGAAAAQQPYPSAPPSNAAPQGPYAAPPPEGGADG